MALNFPDNPTTGQLYTDFTAGFTYEWDGVVWKSYTAAAASNIKIIDDLESSFDDVTVTFPLTSSGTSVTPINPQQLRIVLGGIVQEPAVDYNVSASDIIFTTAPATGLSFSGVLLGGALSPVGLASTGSVYVRQSYSPTGVQTTFTVSGGYRLGYLDVYHNGVKLVVTDDYTATDGSTFDLVTPAQNGDTVEAVTFLYTQLYSTTGILDNLLVTGNATVTGVTTLGGVVKVGVGTTALIVEGDARVTGILTVGTSSITLDGTTDTITTGTLNATTITGSFTGDATGLTGTPNITVGFITATGASISGDVTVGGNVSIAGTLTYEDVTNIDSIGIVTARSGIVLGPTANTIQLGTGTTISSPASDTFTILTGGSERVRVDSNGRFGIGVVPSTFDSTPGRGVLAIDGSTDVALWAGVGGSAKATFQHDGTNAILYNVPNGYLAFGTNNTERARISATGGFSVGTTADPGAGAIYATGDITAFYSSDIRLKKDIEPITEPIKKLMEISGVTYKWNEEYLKDKDVDGYFVRETEVGVIAQEVEKVLPEVVATRENGYKAVRYEKLVALLIEAVKDQQHQIDELKARLEEK